MGKNITICFILYVTHLIVVQAWPPKFTSGGLLELADETRDFIVEQHNNLRSQVALRSGVVGRKQPAAANMRELKWDNGVEGTARGSEKDNVWMNKNGPCSFQGHFPPPGTGENQGRNWQFAHKNPFGDDPTKLNEEFVEGIISGWFAEWRNYTYPVQKHGTGHYTQVVDAYTETIGCAIGWCTYKPAWNPHLQYATNYQLLCQYYGSPNKRSDVYPYNRGSACSQCPPEAPNCENGLCVAGSNYYYDY